MEIASEKMENSPDCRCDGDAAGSFDDSPGEIIGDPN